MHEKNGAPRPHAAHRPVNKKAHALKRDRRHCATLLKYKDSQSRQHRNSNPRKISLLSYIKQKRHKEIQSHFFCVSAKKRLTADLVCTNFAISAIHNINQ